MRCAVESLVVSRFVTHKSNRVSQGVEYLGCVAKSGVHTETGYPKAET
jgi:hypothetical protein